MLKYRPVCIACVLLILGILFCRFAGIPVFGRPKIPESVRRVLESGTTASCSGEIVERNRKKESVQYIIKDCRAEFRDDENQVCRIRIGYLKVTVLLEVTVLPEANFADDNKLAGTGLLTEEELKECDIGQLPVGSRAIFRGKLSEIKGPSNPGEFDSRRYYACRKIFYEMLNEKAMVTDPGGGLREHLASFRERVSARQAKLMHPKQAGVLSAMLLGDRSMLSEESKERYRYGGVMHVLAISGLHISVLGMIFYELLFRVLLLCMPFHIRAGQAIAAVGAAAVTGIYCVFAGSPVSAVRAMIMFGLALGAKILRRSYDVLCAVGISAILLLLTRPGYLFDAGFQLSYAAVGGAAVFYPALLGLVPKNYWHRGSRIKKIFEKILEAFLMWVAVMLCTIPVAAYAFSEIPVLPFATLLIVPAMGAVLILGIVGSAMGMLCPSAGWLLLIPVDLSLQVFERIALFVKTIPGSVWTVGKPDWWQLMAYGFCLLLVWICLRHGMGRRAALVVAAAVLVLSLKWSPALSIAMLDVGQGDSLVISQGPEIWKPGGDSVYLVDGGSSSVKQPGKYRIIPYLKSRGVTRIRGIFVSHGDQDHLNGIEELLEEIVGQRVRIRVDVLYLTAQMQEDAAGRRLIKLCRKAGIRVALLKKGDILEDRKLRIRVMHPDAEPGAVQETGGADGSAADASSGTAGGGSDGTAGGRNEDSMVLLLSFGDFDALLTGDLEGEGERIVLEETGPVEYLKVAHHGSRNSTSAAFLRKASPVVCMISAPEKSRYGHPAGETLTRIREAGAEYYVTRDCGAICLETKGRGSFRIRTFRRKGKKLPDQSNSGREGEVH